MLQSLLQPGQQNLAFVRIGTRTLNLSQQSLQCMAIARSTGLYLCLEGVLQVRGFPASW
jgi:hypothetical protein